MSDGVSKSLKDKMALEKHDFLMRAMKSIFTISTFVVLIFFFLVIYSSFKKGDFPTSADVVSLLGSIISATAKAL